MEFYKLFKRRTNYGQMIYDILDYVSYLENPVLYEEVKIMKQKRLRNALYPLLFANELMASGTFLK